MKHRTSARWRWAFFAGGVLLAVLALAVRLDLFGADEATPADAQVSPALSPQLSPSPSPTPSPRAEPDKQPKEPKEPKPEHEPYDPTGHLHTARGHTTEQGHGPTIRFIAEVEDGINEDPDAFAQAVEDTLFDHRSWPGRFERVDHGNADFHVVLASPELTDELCLPLETAGIYSCFQAGQAVINVMRWKQGAASYGNDLDAYRIYVINHEVGHALGHDHVECPGAGEKAPVMMQQTKGVAPCRPNPWP